MRTKRLTTCSIAVLLLAGLAAPLLARQKIKCPSYKLTALDAAVGTINSYYGYSLDVWNEHLVIGDFFEGGPAESARGALYVYERCGLTWYLNEKILFPDAGIAAALGWHVRMRNGILVGGAPYDNDTVPSSGSVFVYELQGSDWVFAQKLLPSVQSTGMEFGERVDTDGDTVIVGAEGDNTGGAAAGAVFVFDRAGGVWSETARLVASDATANQFFGDVFAFDGDRLLVAVDGDDDAGLDAGAVYVFDQVAGTWSETDKLYASDAGFLTSFGRDIDVDGTRAVVASNLAAYVFEEVAGTWSETAKLVPDSGGPVWGVESVALDGDTLVLGASSGLDEAVFVFQKLGSLWTPTDVLRADDASLGDQFANAVALSGDTIFAGAEDGDAPGAIDAGAAYAFSVSGLGCPSLTASPLKISLSQGGSQLLQLAAGSDHAGSFYALIGSSTGTDPGFSVQGRRVPLLVDDYTLLTLNVGPPNPLVGNSGVLTPGGAGLVFFDVPPASDPTLVGLRLYHAFLAYDLGPFDIGHVSNFVEVSLEI